MANVVDDDDDDDDVRERRIRKNINHLEVCRKLPSKTKQKQQAMTTKVKP